MRGRPVSEMLGFELLDFDITRPASPAEQAELRHLFLEHHLLLIRGQNPSNEDHNRFVQYFGPLSKMQDNGDAGYVSNKKDLGPAGEKTTPAAVTGTAKLLWHADGTYGDRPGIGTSLLAKDVGPDATPTLFANAVRALETLPRDLRAKIENLRAVHTRDTATMETSIRFRDNLPSLEKKPEMIRSCEHPVIYKGPHLDKPILYVNELMTHHIADLPREEGDALLETLYAHITAPESVYTHYWQVGDVIIWDNIALQHCRPEDMGTATRHLRRVSLDGWNKDDGEIIEWFAGGTPRDIEWMKKRGPSDSVKELAKW